MLGKILVGGFIAVAALVGSTGTGHAGLSVDLGIRFGSPPWLAPVPASPVFYAPSVSANLFSYGAEFFVFLSGVWYVGPGHNGPWAVLPPEYVPRPILAVPAKYYRVRPREWSHWHHEAPPRWAPAWGHRWEERRAERHEPTGMSTAESTTRRTGTSIATTATAGTAMTARNAPAQVALRRGPGR